VALTLFQSSSLNRRPRGRVTHQVCLSLPDLCLQNSFAPGRFKEFPLSVPVSNPLNNGGTSPKPLAKSVQLADSPGLTPIHDEAQLFARELFGPDLAEADAVPWNELISQKWLEIARKGLPSERRDQLLRRYEPSETLSFLRSPKLNSERVLRQRPKPSGYCALCLWRGFIRPSKAAGAVVSGCGGAPCNYKGE